MGKNPYQLGTGGKMPPLGQMNPPNGESEVNVGGSSDSPEPHECYTFGQRATLKGAADAQSSQAASPNSTPFYSSQM